MLMSSDLSQVRAVVGCAPGERLCALPDSTLSCRSALLTVTALLLHRDSACVTIRIMTDARAHEVGAPRREFVWHARVHPLVLQGAPRHTSAVDPISHAKLLHRSSQMGSRTLPSPSSTRPSSRATCATRSRRSSPRSRTVTAPSRSSPTRARTRPPRSSARSLPTWQPKSRSACPRRFWQPLRRC